MSNNYFKLFKIEPSFNVNFDELEKKYIDLSVIDINEKESKNMKNINKAYQILKSPLKRAEHLLNIFDIKIKERDHDTYSDVLNESLEIREYLLDFHNLNFVNKLVDEKIKCCIENLTDAFSIKNFNKVIKEILRLKYLYKLLEEIKKYETN